jgi:ADP-heptose:LPS heptosyltransferase
VISERESLGDGFYKLHLIWALKRAYPEEPITWIVSDSDTPYRGKMARIVAPYLDRIIAPAGLRRPWGAAIRRLRALGPFSLAIDSRSNNAVVMATRLLLRTDLYQAATPGYLFCSRRPRGFRSPHKLTRLLALLEAVAGCKIDNTGEIPLPPAAIAAAAVLMPEGERYIGLAPGSTNPARIWPLENYIALARWAVAQGWRPVFLLGPFERKMLAPLSEALPGALYPGCESGEPSGDVELSVAVSRRLAAGVGHDTGTSHLMAAAGVPLVTLFGPSKDRIWAPHARQAVILRSRDFGGPEIERIPLAAVQAAVGRLLGDA